MNSEFNQSTSNLEQPTGFTQKSYQVFQAAVANKKKSKDIYDDVINSRLRLETKSNKFDFEKFY